MNRILLMMLDNKHNSRLLSEWLATRYEMLVPCSLGESATDAASLPDEPFDLCILDGIALNRLWRQVQARREAEKPGFLPFVLITSRPDVKMLTRQLWQSVDELITTPIEKAELHARVEIMLRSRRLSVDLQKANQELINLNDLKTRFVSMASHDLRSPLTAILLSARLLEQYSDKLPPEKKRKHFSIIEERVRYMTQMLDDLLVLSRADVGKLEFNPSPVDLDVFCGKLFDEIQLSASNKHTLAYTRDGECQLPCLDAKLLQHILTNLLTNAIKYSPEGGTVSLEVSCPNGEVIFRVKDQGIGIPPEDLTRLFESFQRASNVGKIPGTGLGLSIVKQCVDLHGGQVAVESEVGAGTTFIVTLPSALSSDQ